VFYASVFVGLYFNKMSNSLFSFGAIPIWFVYRFLAGSGVFRITCAKHQFSAIAEYDCTCVQRKFSDQFICRISVNKYALSALISGNFRKLIFRNFTNFRKKTHVFLETLLPEFFRKIYGNILQCRLRSNVYRRYIISQLFDRSVNESAVACDMQNYFEY
jgi:hypothetical protein